jgi:hypothetical protein
VPDDEQLRLPYEAHVLYEADDNIESEVSQVTIDAAWLEELRRLEAKELATLTADKLPAERFSFEVLNFGNGEFQTTECVKEPLSNVPSPLLESESGVRTTNAEIGPISGFTLSRIESPISIFLCPDVSSSIVGDIKERHNVLLNSEGLRPANCGLYRQVILTFFSLAFDALKRLSGLERLLRRIG